MTIATPKIISTHRDAWFYRPMWMRMHVYNQQYNSIISGEPGSGKSYATLAISHLMDRGADGEPRFNIDNIAFSARQFKDLMKEKMPKGTAIIVDDAALTAYSKDSLTREVKAVSKIFISQRHKNLCVMLSVPSQDMLAKNVKQTILTTIRMMYIDKKKKISYGRLLRNQLYDADGTIYYKRFRTSEPGIHSHHHMPMILRFLRPDLTFDYPPKKFVKEYEKRRKAEMQALYESISDLEIVEKRRRRTAREDMDYVKANIEKFLDSKGKVSKEKLIIDGIGDNRARAITKVLNESGG